MKALTREAAHIKLDEVFDTLEDISRRENDTYDLNRIMLEVQEDDSITGVLLVVRGRGMLDHRHITWGISPYEKGIHSGHYDLSIGQAQIDWLKRVDRGW